MVISDLYPPLKDLLQQRVGTRAVYLVPLDHSSWLQRQAKSYAFRSSRNVQLECETVMKTRQEAVIQITVMTSDNTALDDLIEEA